MITNSFATARMGKLLRGTIGVAAMLLVLDGPVLAQVAVDPNASNQPGLKNSPKNVPVIDITAPNAAGTSHNVFTDFNVGKEGMVLNNSLTGGTSQLGGALDANSNFGSLAAFLILNEVTGSNRSNLLGQTEIFGQAADYVLANPNGITCKGCGFINTPRATLSTGKPILDANGALVGFDVDGGDVRIEQTTGLASNFGADITGVDYFDIVSRSIMVSGLIKGDESKTEIGLFAGRNTYDYANRTVTAKDDDGSAKPEFGIDSTMLGGAYANRITLIGTEKGAGVRTPPEVRAAYGGMSITADGKLIFGHANATDKKITSKGAITAKSIAGDIEIAQNVWSETALDLAAGKKITALERVTATSKGEVKLASQTLDLSRGTLVGAGFDEDGTLVPGGLLTIEMADLVNRGTLRSSGDVTITATGETNNTGLILSGQTLALLGGGTLRNQSTGLISGDDGASFIVAHVINVGTLASSAGDVTATVSGDVDNSGKLAAGRDLTIDAGGAVTLTAQQVASEQNTSIDGGHDNLSTVTNQKVDLDAGGGITIASGADIRLNGVDVTSGGNTVITGQGEVQLAGVKDERHRDFYEKRESGFLNYNATITTEKADESLTVQTTIDSGGNVDITSRSGNLVASAADINAVSDIQLKSETGNVVLKDDRNVVSTETSETKTELWGAIEKSNSKSTDLSDTSQKTDLDAGGQVTIASGADIQLNGANITSGSDTTITGQGEVQLAGVKDEAHGDVYDEDHFGFLNHESTVTTEKVDESLTAQTAINSDGKVNIISNSGNVVASGAIVNAKGDIRLKSEAGNVVLENERNVTSTESFQSNGQLWGINEQTSASTETSDTGEQSIVSASGDVILDSAAGDLIVNGSVVKADRNIQIVAENVDLQAGKDISGNFAETTSHGLIAEAFVTTSGAGLSVGYKSEAQSASLEEQRAQVSTLTAGDSITVDASNDITSEGARLEAENDLNVSAGRNLVIASAHDVITSEEKGSATQVGITVSTTENVASAISPLVSASKGLITGQGNSASQLIGLASTAMQTVEAFSGLALGPLVSVNVGIDASSSSYNATSEASIAQVGQLQTGRDITLQAGHDLGINGARVNAANSILAEAANDMLIQSELSTISDRSTSLGGSGSISLAIGIGVGVGAQGPSVLGGSGSLRIDHEQNELDAVSNSNALISAGDTVTLKSGKNTTIAGARVEGEKVVAEVEGNLNVESRQDTIRSSSLQAGGSLSLGIGTLPLPALKEQIVARVGTETDDDHDGQKNAGGIGFIYEDGKRDRAFTEEQTAIIATNSVDLTVGNNTHLKGAVINAENGTQTIDTATLTFEDVQDYDRSSNFDVGLNMTNSFDGSGETGDKQQAGFDFIDLLENTGFKLEGGSEKAVKEGISRTTVGEGEIGIRNTEQQAELEASGKTGKLAALNRNLDTAQEITRDESKQDDFFSSDESLKHAFETPGESFGKPIEVIIDHIADQINIPEGQKDIVVKIAKAALEFKDLQSQLRSCVDGICTITFGPQETLEVPSEVAVSILDILKRVGI